MNTLNPRDFQNIIFDFGGVIIDLDIDKCVHNFAEITGKSDSELLGYISTENVFHKIEKGEISNQDFFEGVLELSNKDFSYAQFARAWNSMIGALPLRRLKLLDELKQSHNTFLLSNTNQLHLDRVTEITRELIPPFESIDHYFEKAYYSHHIGLRKPGKEIYEFVIEDSKLDVVNTIFLDDNLHNLEGARLAGLNTLVITREVGILDIF